MSRQPESPESHYDLRAFHSLEAEQQLEEVIMNRVSGMMKAEKIGSRMDSLRFKKTGRQISDSIGQKIENNLTKITTLTKESGEICKRRELVLQEVLDAGTDDARNEAYRTSTMSKYETSGTANVIKALQRDLDTLFDNNYSIERAKHDNESLSFLRTHLQLDGERVFDLDVEELISLF